MIPLKRERWATVVKLGEMVYECFTQGKLELKREEFEEEWQKILSLEEEIEELEERIHLLRGEGQRKRCVTCGKYIDKSALYCSHCGAYQGK